jgi:hypothetical protein
MNGMGLPVETRVLHDGQVLTPEAFVARSLHPANAGQVLTGITVAVDLDLRVSGGDGHTISPPALPCGNGEHPGGSSAAPSGVSPHHQFGARQTWTAPVIAALKERPGEWAKVRTCPSRTTAGSSAQHLRLKGLEATSRGCDVWARWLEGGAA